MLIRLTIIIFALYLPMANAQQVEFCETDSSDVDGDGWGWENGMSCKVIASTDIPQFTNQETGQPVVLQRAYWSEDDITAVSIACNDWYFDGTEYQVIVQEKLITAEALSLVAPHTGEVEVAAPSFGNSDLLNTTVIWQLNNGVYIGPTGLGYSPWIEVISIDYTVPPITVEAVRIWTSEFAHTRCRSVDPRRSFVPTGTPAVDTTCVDYDGDGWGWDGSTSCRP